MLLLSYRTTNDFPSSKKLITGTLMVLKLFSCCHSLTYNCYTKSYYIGAMNLFNGLAAWFNLRSYLSVVKALLFCPCESCFTENVATAHCH